MGADVNSRVNKDVTSSQNFNSGDISGNFWLYFLKCCMILERAFDKAFSFMTISREFCILVQY